MSVSKLESPPFWVFLKMICVPSAAIKPYFSSDDVHLLRLSQCKEDLAARKVRCLSPLGRDFCCDVGDHTIDFLSVISFSLQKWDTFIAHIDVWCHFSIEIALFWEICKEAFYMHGHLSPTHRKACCKIVLGLTTIEWSNPRLFHIGVLPTFMRFFFNKPF